MISGLVVGPVGLSWILLELLIRFQKVEPNAVQILFTASIINHSHKNRLSNLIIRGLQLTSTEHDQMSRT
jgi:hypothetical protein